MRRIMATLLLILAAAAAAVAAVNVSTFSSATFVATTSNTGTVDAAPDWTPPTVTMNAPAGSVSGTVTVSATASDTRSGVASVAIQRQAVGAETWTTICTDTTSPYSCSWNTTQVSDGQYDLRAVAVDNAAYTATSESVRTVVANNVVVVLTEPGEFLRGDVPLTTTVYGGTSLTYNITVEYAPTGTTQWKTACTSSSVLSGQSSCTWRTVTSGIANGVYDLRATARPTVGGAFTSAVVTEVTVDNTAPTASIVNPGSPLRGTVTLAATATETQNESGVAQVVIQYAPGSTSNYQTACTITVEPYSCRFDTTKIADGTYSFRAVATDFAGNTTTTSAVTNRTVDNTVSSVSLEDPGAFLTGTETLVAQASSTAGVASVKVQYATSGGTNWTDICTDTSSPYSCTWDTTKVADGLYDLRAVLVDGKDAQTISATVSARRVDNAPLRGVDIQTANGGGTAGRIDSGDAVTFTYSRTVDPATVSSGWNGQSLAVTARFRDGNVSGVGTGNKGDTLDVRIGSTNLNLGSVNLKEDYLRSGRTVTFNATLTATTVSVDGVDRTVITLRIGTRSSGSNSNLRTVSLTSAMVWSPSAAARTPEGTACSTAAVTESGGSDREF